MQGKGWLIGLDVIAVVLAAFIGFSAGSMQPVVDGGVTHWGYHDSIHVFGFLFKFLFFIFLFGLVGRLFFWGRGGWGGDGPQGPYGPQGGYWQGADLGLAIARQLVQTHGGCISVENQVDTGTMFTVELRRAS